MVNGGWSGLPFLVVVSASAYERWALRRCGLNLFRYFAGKGAKFSENFEISLNFALFKRINEISTNFGEILPKSRRNFDKIFDVLRWSEKNLQNFVKSWKKRLNFAKIFFFEKGPKFRRKIRETRANPN